MLGKEERHLVPRDLHEDRKVWLEAMLPLDRESEAVDIERPALGTT